MNILENNHPIFVTQIGDMCIESVLDVGFLLNGETKMTDYLHSHSYYEIFVTITGEFNIMLSNGTLLAMPVGSVCMIPSGYFHRTFSVDNSCIKLAIRFQYSRASADASSVYQTCNAFLSQLSSPMVIDNDYRLADILQKLQKELKHIDYMSDAYIPILLNQFYIESFRAFLRVHIQSPGECNGTQISKSLRQIQIDEFFTTHYRESITEEDMARVFHISKRQLNRILRNTYRMSFREILVNTRMHSAADLLVSTEYSIEEIAAMIGYTSLSGFYSAFQKKYGITAGKYRKHIRN